MAKQTVAVIDYGMGNLHSVSSALHTVAPELSTVVTADPELILKADRVVFPGVGAIGDCMSEIKRLAIDEVIADVIKAGKPLLGICVGMQALMNSSEESGGTPCLGVFDGDVRFFSANATFASATDEACDSKERLKVPHMGWNQVSQNIQHPLFANIEDNSRFYFVHSFYTALKDKSVRAGSAHYGVDFTAAVARDNVFAVQFHPEKSHKNGLKLLQNFVYWSL